VTGAIRIGCSGWVYPDWRGRFYPRDLKSSAWFAHYAAAFDTVEINNTFYRLPTPEAVEGWERQAPPGFLYAVKVGQFGSHRMKLRDPSSWVANHLDRVRRLGEHLGPNLVQLPPRWRRNVERLDEFLTAMPEDIRVAVEFREPSWLHDDVFDCLARHGAALCIHDLLPNHPWFRTSDWTYVRFHGPRAVSHPYHGRYRGTRLWRGAQRLSTWRDEGTDIYAYFNNDWDAAAVDDARWLRARLTHLAAAA
jgi:uncharacterized protein YecE (DUF72 family)